MSWYTRWGRVLLEFRLHKLKESENGAYSDIFCDPYDDESLQNKAPREEEEKEEAELEDTAEGMWSSFSMGGDLYEELALSDIHVFPIETSTFNEIQLW